MLSSQEEIQQNEIEKEININNSEWYTKDEITGEILFLKQGVLYSKFPNEQITQILSLFENPNKIKSNKQKENKDQNKKNEPQSFHSIMAKFSTVLSSKNIQIFGGGSIATLNSDDYNDEYVIVSNLIPKGIVSIELICPISCTNLSFGMCSKNDIENGNVSKKTVKSFRNTSRRKVILHINYHNYEVSFYLNGELNEKTLKFKEDAIYPCIFIEKKNTSVILNPNVHYNVSKYKNDILKKLLIFTTDPSKEIYVGNSEGLLNYFNNSFNKKIEIKNILGGDVNEKGILNNFFLVKFKDKKNIFDLKNKFSSICINQNLSFIDYSNNKEISKKLLINSDLSFIHKKLYLTSLNYKFQPEENNIKERIIKFMIDNFKKINFLVDFSVEIAVQIQNSYINSNKEDIFDFMKTIKNYYDKEKCDYKINYLPQNDSILFMKENKLKIIKRDNNGKFNYINLKEINEEKDKNIILIKYDDLKFFTQKFEFEKFLCNSPSQSKFVYVRNFFESLLHSKKLGNDYILLPIFNGILFFTMVADFLNTKSIISKKQQQLDNLAKEKKEREKDNKESKEKENKPLKDKLSQEAKDNKQLYEELPFSLNYDAESISKDDETDSTISYEQYSDYIINDPLEFSRMRFIINSIIVQLSIKYPNEKIITDQNIYSSFHNLASFVNYPFYKDQDITQ